MPTVASLAVVLSGEALPTVEAQQQAPRAYSVVAAASNAELAASQAASLQSQAQPLELPGE